MKNPQPCRVDIRDACPTCGAREGEACQSKTGLAQAGMNRLSTDKMHGGLPPLRK